MLSWRVHDAASNTILQFVSTFSVWLLADRPTLSPIITVVYAMTLAIAARRETRAGDQLLFGLGDRGSS
jgi:hypothetical protein